MKSNIEYLFESIRNKETLDKRYMTLDKDENLTKILDTSRKIKTLLKQIKCKKKKNKNYTQQKNDLYQLVISEHGSKTEFGCFINACDSTVATLKSNEEFFSEIIELYFTHREFDNTISSVWTQALIDKGSQRSMGSIGEEKLIDIAKTHGFEYTNDTNTFFNNTFSISKYSKKIKDGINKGLNFGSQNKKLDIVIKAKDLFFFLEAKHIKDSGGAQDKQIKELIGLFQNKMPNKQFIVSFLDGVYSNTLLDISEPILSNPTILTINNQSKLITQKFEIITSLKDNPQAIWVNSKGYELLLEDIKNI